MLHACTASSRGSTVLSSATKLSSCNGRQHHDVITKATLLKEPQASPQPCKGIQTARTTKKLIKQNKEKRQKKKLTLPHPPPPPPFTSHACRLRGRNKPSPEEDSCLTILKCQALRSLRPVLSRETALPSGGTWFISKSSVRVYPFRSSPLD